MSSPLFPAMAVIWPSVALSAPTEPVWVPSPVIRLPVAELFYLPLTGQKALDEWIALLDREAGIIGFAPVDGF